MPFVVGEIPLRTLLFSNTDNARGMLLMSEVFATHLHSGKSCSIFALARGCVKIDIPSFFDFLCGDFTLPSLGGYFYTFSFNNVP